MTAQEKKTRIIKMVNKWNKVRWNHKKALTLFSSGAYFAITPEDVRMWANAPVKPQNIHCYIGIENKKMYFILIDSETDKKPLTELEGFELDKIVIRKFNNTLDIFTPNFIDKATDGNVTVNEALSRNLRWQLMKGSWIKEQIESVRDMQVGIVRVFSSPFSDLENIVRTNSNGDILAIMGLKPQDTPKISGKNNIYDEKSPYQLDLCFWGVNTKNRIANLRSAAFTVMEASSPVEDLTVICPPYKEESYSLIFTE